MGSVGQPGQNKEVKGGLFLNFRKTVQKELEAKLQESYTASDEENTTFLKIEYKIKNFGTEENLDKRHRLEEKMDEVLGWTGLGHTDGGSSGTVEARCIVVDFDLAKNIIEEAQKDTALSDYSRIYKMDDK